jgi:hypothetical protein
MQDATATSSSSSRSNGSSSSSATAVTAATARKQRSPTAAAAAAGYGCRPVPWGLGRTQGLVAPCRKQQRIRDVSRNAVCTAALGDAAAAAAAGAAVPWHQAVG